MWFFLKLKSREVSDVAVACFFFILSNPLQHRSFDSGCRTPGRYHRARFANTVQLLATSCADIIVEHGTPFYMKIDVEDATKMCLDSLGEIVEASRPALISAEHLVLLAKFGQKNLDKGV